MHTNCSKTAQNAFFQHALMIRNLLVPGICYCCTGGHWLALAVEVDEMFLSVKDVINVVLVNAHHPWSCCFSSQFYSEKNIPSASSGDVVEYRQQTHSSHVCPSSVTPCERN